MGRLCCSPSLRYTDFVRYTKERDGHSTRKGNQTIPDRIQKEEQSTTVPSPTPKPAPARRASAIYVPPARRRTDKSAKIQPHLTKKKKTQAHPQSSSQRPVVEELPETSLSFNPKEDAPRSVSGDQSFTSARTNPKLPKEDNSPHFLIQETHSKESPHTIPPQLGTSTGTIDLPRRDRAVGPLQQQTEAEHYTQLGRSTEAPSKGQKRDQGGEAVRRCRGRGFLFGRTSVFSQDDEFSLDFPTSKCDNDQEVDLTEHATLLTGSNAGSPLLHDYSSYTVSVAEDDEGSATELKWGSNPGGRDTEPAKSEMKVVDDGMEIHVDQKMVDYVLEVSGFDPSTKTKHLEDWFGRWWEGVPAPAAEREEEGEKLPRIKWVNVTTALVSFRSAATGLCLDEWKVAS
jgi:hypothetical protein